MATKKRWEKGKIVGVITTEGEFVKGSELKPADSLYETDEVKKGEAGEGGTSKQAEEKFGSVNKLQSRTYDPGTMVTLMENVTPFSSCVRQVTADTVAGGYRVVGRTKEDDGTDADMAAAEAFLSSDAVFPWPKTPQRLVKQLLFDYNTIGYCAMEISRNSGGLVDGLFYLPGKTMWVYDKQKNGKHVRKYCQKVGQTAVWFKPFGEERVMDSTTGDYSDAVKGGQEANEVLFIWEIHPRNEYYGVPRVASSIGAMNSLLRSRAYNSAFFENHGVPAYLIKLKGAWEDGADKTLQEFFTSVCYGEDNAQKTMVLQMPEDMEAGGDENRYGDVVIEPVEVIENKEGGFQLMRKEDAQEIRSAFSMPPYRVGVFETGSLAGNLGEEASEIYRDSVIGPLAEDFGAMFTAILHRGLGLESVKFEWQYADLRDKGRELERGVKAVESGLKSIGDVCRDLGYPDPPADLGAQYFIKSTLIPVAMADEVSPSDRQSAAVMEALQALKDGNADAARANLTEIAALQAGEGGGV